MIEKVTFLFSDGSEYVLDHDIESLKKSELIQSMLDDEEESESTIHLDSEKISFKCFTQIMNFILHKEDNPYFVITFEKPLTKKDIFMYPEDVFPKWYRDYITEIAADLDFNIAIVKAAQYMIVNELLEFLCCHFASTYIKGKTVEEMEEKFKKYHGPDYVPLYDKYKKIKDEKEKEKEKASAA